MTAETEKRDTDAEPSDEQQEYQVTVWALKEVDALLDVGSEAEAIEEIKANATRDHPIQTRDLREDTVEATETRDGRYNAAVWGLAEYVETVQASSESEAEEGGKEFVCREYGISTKGVRSVEATEVGS